MRITNLACALTLFCLAANPGSVLALNHEKESSRSSSPSSAGLKVESAPADLETQSTIWVNPSGKPWENLTDRISLSSGMDRVLMPLSATSADFDQDGVPDLAVSYQAGGSGRIAVYRGMEHALLSAIPGTKPFTKIFDQAEIPEAATWIFAGDYNADDRPDVVTAARGSSALYWLEGNGRGGFDRIHTLHLDGTVTAIAGGEINRADLLADVVVAIEGSKGPQVLAFESPLGALQDDPEILDVKRPVSALALGQFDDSYEKDLAVAAENRLLIVHGRDRRLSQGRVRRAEVRPAAFDSIEFPDSIKSLAYGDFAGDYRTELAVLSYSGRLQLLERDGTKWMRNDVGAIGTDAATLLEAFISGGPHQNLISLDSQGRMSALSSTASGLSMAPRAGNDSVAAALPMKLNGDALEDLVVLRQDSPDPLLLISAPAAVFTVNSTLDTPDAVINGACNDGAGNCTLRAALQEANATVGLDSIGFNIPGAGPFTIAPASALPAITAPVFIAGNSQPGSSSGVWPPILLIELNAAAAGGVGLQINSTGSGTTIAGMVINRSTGPGIFVNGSNNNQIQYNLIGTDVTGTIDLGNTADGIRIQGLCANNVVGGNSIGFRNLISGNNGNSGVIVRNGPASGNIIQGNYFGTDVNAAVALPNSVVANVAVAFNVAGTIIGGATSGARNIISGNDFAHGIILQGTSTAANDVSGTLIANNFIGLNASGTVAIGNSQNGVRVLEAPNTTIGGVTGLARNVVSANAPVANFVNIFMDGGGGTTNTLIQGNLVGTNAQGTAGLGTTGFGIATQVATGTVIGGTVPAARNIVTSNRFEGIAFFLSGSSGNFVLGNYVGLNAAGNSAIPNGDIGIYSNAANNTIGGVDADARNVVSASASAGIMVDGTSSNTIAGNFVGTDAAGTFAIPNGNGGIFITGALNVIGGSEPGAGNLVSGNVADGILITGTLNTVKGNAIGMSSDGHTFLGNTGSGINITAGANTIGGRIPGEGNVIAFNAFSGIVSTSLSPNPMIGNAAFLNGALDIDLNADGVSANDAGDGDGGANSTQNFPVLTSVQTIGSFVLPVGSLSSAPSTAYDLDFYSASECGAFNMGGGRNYLGHGVVNTDALGDATFGVALLGTLNPGDVVTSTATDPLGNTSENSNCVCFIPPLTASSNSPVCSGQTLLLFASDIAGGAYLWTGPNGFISDIHNPVIPNVTTAAAGTYSVTVQAGFCVSAPTDVSVTVNQSPSISPVSLPSATMGVAYNASITATGGAGPFTFAVTDGALPAGLTLASDGVLSGTPTVSGISVFTVAATDTSSGCGSSRVYTLQVDCSVIDFTTPSLPDGTVGVAYNQTISATGGSGTLTFTLTEGALPSGLSLAGNGAIAGTPTESGVFLITVAATDSFGCQADRTYVLIVGCPALQIFPLSLPNGTIGAAYSQAFGALGGTQPYSFAVSLGSLPSGLTLNSNGTLTGTPTATGSFNFVVTATDAVGCTVSAPYTLVIDCAAITLDPATLPQLLPNVFYDVTLTASGGSSPYSFAVTSGALPSGLTLNSSTGQLSGTTTSSGNFAFTVTVTDAAGCTGSREYVLNGCVFCADFEDGVLDTGWTYTGNWSETGGSLVGAALSGKAVAVASPVFGGCTLCSFEATVQTAGGVGNKVSFFGWYVDSKNAVELMMNESTDKWILKQRVGGVIIAKAKGASVIDPGVFYDVRMVFDGSNFQVFVDNNPVITMPSGATPFGTASFQAKKTTGTFGSIIVN